MSRYLTAQGFANAPPMLGEVVRVTNDGARWSLAVAQGFVRNQGDGWAWTLDQLQPRARRSRRRRRTRRPRADEVADYKTIAAVIGRRLGEMHAVLARPSDDAGVRARDRHASAMSKRGSRAQLTLVDRAFALLKKQCGVGERDDRGRGETPAVAARLADARTAAAGQGGRRHRHDPHPRRLPSRPGAGRERRHLHHRFRGRARAPARRAPRQGKPAARRRRLAALVRLCGGRDARPEADHRRRRSRRSSARNSSGGCATAPSAHSSTPIARAARPRENADLLDFFLIEKAAYELAYEAANRPAWLPIPIKGLADLVRASRDRRKEQAMNVRTAPSAPSLDRRDTDALAHALHGDPFRLLGPHETPAGPVVRAFLPGAQSVEVLRRSDGARIGAARSRRRRAVPGQSSASARLISCASPGPAPCRRRRIPIRSVRCSAISICICSTKAATSSSRRRSAPT